jgi:predicted amidohydrolase
LFSSDPADLFTQLYDILDARLGGEPLQPGVALEWLTDELSQEVASWIEGSTVVDGSLESEGIEDSINQVDDPDEPEEGLKRVFAILCGLDRAFAHINPHTATYDQGALRPLAVRYAERGRFNSPATRGALLPRYAFPGRETVVPESLVESFVNVVRVPPRAWAMARHATIPNRSDFGRLERQRGIRVGCVPAVQELGEVQLELVENVDRRFYAAHARLETVGSRAAEILDKLDASGAAIGVLPELALTDEILEVWKDVAVQRSPERTSRLKWLFIGTGSVGGDSPPANRGVLIDRRTGETLLEQDKMFPFTLDKSQLTAWGLERVLGEEPCGEFITRGRRLSISECGLGRLAIFICEDLARIASIGGGVLAHGVSFALAPVFSAEIQEHYWEHAHAKDYASQVGTQVVVANSLVIARAMGLTGKVGTALAHGPAGWVIGESEAPTDICLFSLSVEAAVTAVPAPPRTE